MNKTCTQGNAVRSMNVTTHILKAFHSPFYLNHLTWLKFFSVTRSININSNEMEIDERSVKSVPVKSENFIASDIV